MLYLALDNLTFLGAGYWYAKWLCWADLAIFIAGIGYGLVQKGLDALKHEDLAPRQTAQTVKENVEWAKEQTS